MVCAAAAAGCKSGDDDSGGGMAGIGVGTGGTTAAGTGGMTATVVTPGMTGATAAATIAGFGTGTVTGTATFTQNDGNVSVTVVLNGCEDGAHPVHIHQGTACDSAETQMAHWDMTRGEGIPDVMCTGGTGMSMLTRPATDPALAWTVGGEPNVIGHAFVVHNADMMKTRIGCGVIAAQ